MEESELLVVEARLIETGRRIAELLATDVEAFFTGAVRDRVVGAPDGASLTDEALRAWKVQSRAAADEAATALRSRLSAHGVWVEARPAAEASDIRAHPVVAEALSEVERRLAELLAHLEAEGLPAGGAVPYRLPARFIDGENLQVLTRNYWRKLARLGAGRGDAAQRQALGRADERRRRWDDA